MRKKLWISLSIAMILALGTGTAWFNRTNAQDTPKKVEPAEKSEDLFNQLKKALEEKKLEPLIPAPANGPTFPPLSKPTVPTTDPSLPPPVNVGSPTPAPVALDPAPVLPKKAGVKPELPKANWTLPTDGPAPVQPPLPKSAIPAIEKETPQIVDFPPRKPPVSTPSNDPVVQSKPGEPPPPPTVNVTPVLSKDSPWSLHVQMINGQTVVTATVNKKHEFKIVCQTLDLQTGKNTLKAIGKVTITGDMMNGHCDHLAIPLMEDRLVMEGTAQVSIQKLSGNVSSEKAATFELKGATLDLRISELQGTSVQQTTWPVQPTATAPRDTAGIEGRTVARTATGESKQWTPYGVLRRADGKLGAFYTLESTNGTSLAVAAREGGSLDEYVGRTISVLGRMEQIQGSMKLRVTHIALP